MSIAPFMIRNHGGHIGRASPRSDGPLKVAGGAVYAAEHNPVGVLHGYPVMSKVASGKIAAIRTQAAENMPGVVGVLTHLNVPEQGALPPAGADFFTKLLGPKPVLAGDEVVFAGQYVALVIAETFEGARGAAALIEVDIDAATPTLDFEAALSDSYTPREINGGGEPDTAEGDIEAGLRSAAVVIDETYDTPYEHCNAMEPHAAVAEWRDDRLFVEGSSQAATICAASLAATLQLAPGVVRVTSRFVGGGFGSKFGMRPQVAFAALGAKVTGRPVKVALTRQQNYSAYGHRTPVRQRIRLGASRDGRLIAFSKECWS